MFCDFCWTDFFTISRPTGSLFYFMIVHIFPVMTILPTLSCYISYHAYPKWILMLTTVSIAADTLFEIANKVASLRVELPGQNQAALQIEQVCEQSNGVSIHLLWLKANSHKVLNIENLYFHKMCKNIKTYFPFFFCHDCVNQIFKKKFGELELTITSMGCFFFEYS